MKDQQKWKIKMALILLMLPSICSQNYLINKDKFQITVNQKISPPSSHPHTFVPTLMSLYSQNDLTNIIKYKIVQILRLPSPCSPNHVLINKRDQDCIRCLDPIPMLSSIHSQNHLINTKITKLYKDSEPKILISMITSPSFFPNAPITSIPKYWIPKGFWKLINKKLTDYHKKITGIPRENGNKNLTNEKNWHKIIRKKLPHCPGCMLWSPCSMLKSPWSHLKICTYSNVQWQRLIIESRNGFENWSTKKLTDHHKKITGIPTVNSDGNLNHEKQFDTRQQEKSCLTLPASCSVPSSCPHGHN